MFKKFFMFTGRISRSEYGISLFIFTFFSDLIRTFKNVNGVDNLILYAFILLFWWFILAQGAKRCHDLGKNGGYQFIPFYGFWMLFSDGEFGDNIYGADSKNRFEILGIANLNPDEIQKSIYYYNNVIKANPNDAQAFLNRGSAKYHLGDTQSAIEDYDLAIEIEPKNADAYFNRGVAKSDLNDRIGAISDYTQSIDFNNNGADAYYNRGLARHDFGDYIGAISDYTKAIDLIPDDGEVYYNRGIAKFALGDKQEALLDWEKAGEMGYSEALELIKKNCN